MRIKNTSSQLQTSKIGLFKNFVRMSLVVPKKELQARQTFFFRPKTFIKMKGACLTERKIFRKKNCTVPKKP